MSYLCNWEWICVLELKWQRNCSDIFDVELPNVTQMWLLLVNYVYPNITDYHIWFWFFVCMAHHNNLVFPKTLAFKTLHELEYANKYSNSNITQWKWTTAGRFLCKQQSSNRWNSFSSQRNSQDNMGISRQGDTQPDWPNLY